MSPGEKRTAGQVVSPEELDDLVKSLQAIYMHLRTNRRHLDKIEEMAERVKAQVEALLPEEVPEEEPAAEG